MRRVSSLSSCETIKNGWPGRNDPTPRPSRSTVLARKQPDSSIKNQLDDLILQIEQKDERFRQIVGLAEAASASSQTTDTPLAPVTAEPASEHDEQGSPELEQILDDLEDVFETPQQVSAQSADEPLSTDSTTTAGELADQIQELLNKALQTQADTKSTADEAPVAQTPPAESPLTDNTTSGISSAAKPADQPGALEEDLDVYLADRADDAVAGDFETVKQVPGANGDVADAPANKTDVELEDAFETSRQAAGGIDAVDTESVKAPEQAAASEQGSTAADVLRELDEQPPPTAAEQDGVPKPAGPTLRKRLAIIVTGARLAAWPLRIVCAVIYKPFGKISRPTRDLIGYFALLQLFIGSVILINAGIKWLVS